MPESVKRDASAVFRLIAEAESSVHGVPMDQIHFHEVGSMDAVTDVVAVSLLIDIIKPDRITATPVNVGSGHVHCAHGILPVPAPATAKILHGIPIYSGHVRGELCTPTGAALLKHFVSEFCQMPAMVPRREGYGMGTKDFEAANCVRATAGDAEDRADSVVELSCNVDDMTPEAIGFAMERFFADGALEVYTVPLGMKKSRPGSMICVMCREGDKERLIASIFRHTTTIGLRETSARRHVLDRQFSEVSTPSGSVRVKSSSGYGTTRKKYEFEDIAAIAREIGKSLFEVIDEIDKW